MSQGYPKGRVWLGTRGPFSGCCHLRAAYRLACVGGREETGKRWERLGVGSYEVRAGERDRPRDRQTDLAWATPAPWVPQVEV